MQFIWTNHYSKAFKGHLIESQNQSKQGPHTDKSVWIMSFPVVMMPKEMFMKKNIGDERALCNWLNAEQSLNHW